jgi:hypothetical protein
MVLKCRHSVNSILTFQQAPLARYEPFALSAVVNVRRAARNAYLSMFPKAHGFATIAGMPADSDQTRISFQNARLSLW